MTTELQDDLDLSKPGMPSPDPQLSQVKTGVRGYLALQRLVNRAPSPTVRTTRAPWWPKQGAVHYAPLDAAEGAKKMFAILSEDDWNARPGASYSTCAKLTSKPRSAEHWRTALEVPVTGGVVVAGHLYLLPHAATDAKRPNPPRSSALSALLFGLGR